MTKIKEGDKVRIIGNSWGGKHPIGFEGVAYDGGEYGFRVSDTIGRELGNNYPYSDLELIVEGTPKSVIWAKYLEESTDFTKGKFYKWQEDGERTSGYSTSDDVGDYRIVFLEDWSQPFESATDPNQSQEPVPQKDMHPDEAVKAIKEFLTDNGLSLANISIVTKEGHFYA